MQSDIIQLDQQILNTPQKESESSNKQQYHSKVKSFSGNRNSKETPSTDAQQNDFQSPNNLNQASFISSASRCYTLFSKSSFCTSKSYFYSHKNTKKYKNVPQVKLSMIFKNKSAMYLDEQLENTFDEILENGLNVIQIKKAELVTLKQQEEVNTQQINELKEELKPIVSAFKQLQGNLDKEQDYKRLLEQECTNEFKVLSHYQNQIRTQKQKCENDLGNISQQISKKQNYNKQIQQQIQQSKSSHITEIQKHDEEIKKIQQLYNTTTEKLNNIKSQYSDLSSKQSVRMDKMKNKQKMYLGILKH